MVSIQAQIVLLHLGTDGPCFIQAQIVPLHAGTDRPFLCGQPAPLRLRTASQYMIMLETHT